MVKIVKLMIGLNEHAGKKLLKKKFKGLSWWSDNLETVAHYYEGCVLEITVKLDPKKKMDYVRSLEDLDCMLDHYTYGFAEMNCPKGATWYSFNASYLKDNVVSIKEIFPDLSKYNEEGTGY